MKNMVERITVYPIKSVDGHDVRRAEVLASGALQHDRRWALVDRQGRTINGKRVPQIQRIRAAFDLDAMRVELRSTATESHDRLSLESVPQLAEWFSDALGIACRVLENETHGFPDDTDVSGPTLVSRGSLERIASWFPTLDVDEIRRRFRANIEISIGEPFWEDRLFGPDPQRPVRFHVGDVAFVGVHPCQRCAVPPRSSQTGEVGPPEFAREFAARREQELPDSAERAAFDHFYRFAVNTRLASLERTPTIRLGDEIRI